MFCRWIEKTPDQLIAECKDAEDLPSQKALAHVGSSLDEYVGNLQADGLSPGSIATYIMTVKTFYRINGLRVELPYRLKRTRTYPGKAPTPEMLQRLIDIADLRDKVIISCLALGGFRESTLCRLEYRHIKDDFERGIIPIHVHVEANITKGKYHDYDTFLGPEAANYIKAYLDTRKRGSPRGYIPPETITDTSPLIRNECAKQPKPIQPLQIYKAVHNLYLKAGLIGSKNGRLYEIRPHSIRKFFRTQLTALGVQNDYVEYMMGHTISTYHNIQSKGVEFLRTIYTTADLQINQKEKPGIYDLIEEIVKSKGYSINRDLLHKAIAELHRTIISREELEEEKRTLLREKLLQILREDLT